MAKPTGGILPHRLNFGAGFCRTPTGARKEVWQICWPATSGAVGNIPLATAGKEPIIAGGCEGLDVCQGVPEQGWKKDQGTVVHPLMPRFRSHLQLCCHWWGPGC